MSTNSECEFVERTPGEWYYILEDYNAPKNAWSWKDYATAYGPFPTFDVAYEHLGNNHANPGGYFTTHHGEYRKSETDEKLFEEARLRKDREAIRNTWRAW